MNLIKKQALSATLFAALCTAGGAQAALISSTVDTFSNDGTTGVIPAAYTGVGPVDRNGTDLADLTSTLSVVNPASDGDNLDALNDGYLLIQRNGESNAGAIRDLGTVEAGDVGSVVTIDVDSFRPGAGVNVFFGLQLQNPDDTVENTVPEVSLGFGNTAGLLSTLSGSALSYEVTNADIGKELQFFARAFVSGDNGRELALDAVSITVVPVPEPGSLALAASGLGLLIMRRRH